MQDSASASDTCATRRPITTPSSTSQSVDALPRGIVTASCGPASAEVALLNRMGSAGIFAPVSAAWRA